MGFPQVKYQNTRPTHIWIPSFSGSPPATGASTDSRGGVVGESGRVGGRVDMLEASKPSKDGTVCLFTRFYLCFSCLFVCFFVCLFLCFFVSLFVGWFVCLLVDWFVGQLVCLFVNPWNSELLKPGCEKAGSGGSENVVGCCLCWVSGSTRIRMSFEVLRSISCFFLGGYLEKNVIINKP